MLCHTSLRSSTLNTRAAPSSSLTLAEIFRGTDMSTNRRVPPTAADAAGMPAQVRYSRREPDNISEFSGHSLTTFLANSTDVSTTHTLRPPLLCAHSYIRNLALEQMLSQLVIFSKQSEQNCVLHVLSCTLSKGLLRQGRTNYVILVHQNLLRPRGRKDDI